MPASVRLLQKVKEAWGEEVTQDLVAWVNEGQAVNRAELRELADLYFARFSERLDERIAGSERKLDSRTNSLQLDIARVEGKLDAGFATLHAEFTEHMRAQLKWMFLFWAGTIVPLAGLIVALGKGWL